MLAIRFGNRRKVKSKNMLLGWVLAQINSEGRAIFASPSSESGLTNKKESTQLTTQKYSQIGEDAIIFFSFNGW